jgi:LysM repeat protein
VTVTPGADAPDIDIEIATPERPPATRPTVEDRSLGQGATRRICPFLTIEGGGWRSAIPTRDHRCGAVAPAATLAMDKQRRLCLAEAHNDCPTFLAAIGTPVAGGLPVTPAFAGHPPPGPHPAVTRWGLVRTVPVVLDRTRPAPAVRTMARDRRGGQLLVGGLLVAAVAAVAVARFSGGPAGVGAVTSPTPTVRTTATPTSEATPAPTVVPTLTSAASPSPAPTPTPTASAAATPVPSYRTYTVRSGDTLSRIANQFGTTVSAIAKLNNIKPEDYGRLSVGRVLKIP